MTYIDEDWAPGSAEDKVYEDIGRHWSGLAEFAQKYDFKMGAVIFTKNGSEIRMTIEQLERPGGIMLLRTALAGMQGTRLIEREREKEEEDES